MSIGEPSKAIRVGVGGGYLHKTKYFELGVHKWAHMYCPAWTYSESNDVTLLTAYEPNLFNFGKMTLKLDQRTIHFTTT